MVGDGRQGAWAMLNWEEVRTAYLVGRLGTVSGAAEVLGVHHATVIRHVDALEKTLGSKLFQRHARGYAPTEAGRDLMIVAESAEGQFTQMVSRIKGLGDAVTGELVVTSIAGAAGLITPVLATFQAEHPGLMIRFLTDMRLFRLDHGEAHVAIRAGGVPKEPDYVVQPLARLCFGLYASRSYLQQHGQPGGLAEFGAHRFVAIDGTDARAPFHIWMRAHVPEANMVYRVTETAATFEAVRAGIGIGFLAKYEAAPVPELVEIMPALPEWQSHLWAVTHVDLHRTLKVQKFLAHLKVAAKGWSQDVESGG